MPSAPAKYTEQLIIMVTPDTKAHLRAVAAAEAASLSEVSRVYLDAGISLGGGLDAPEEPDEEPEEGDGAEVTFEPVLKKGKKSRA